MQTQQQDTGASQDQRRQWMAVLAGATPTELEEAWERTAPKPAYDFLRAPQTGLAMVRGRVGGSGRPFNLGEMTMTRCVVRLAGGAMGFGYVAGRDARKAELAAVFDALLQDGGLRAALMDEVLAPLAEARDARKARTRAETAPTKVDFFTMVRGED